MRRVGVVLVRVEFVRERGEWREGDGGGLGSSRTSSSPSVHCKWMMRFWYESSPGIGQRVERTYTKIRMDPLLLRM